MSKKKIRHRNELNSTLMAMNISEKRIVYIAFSQCPYDEETGRIIFEDDRIYIISSKQYAEICGISESQAYKQLHAGVEGLQKTIIKIQKQEMGDDLDFKDEADDAIVMFSMVDYCVYSDGDGYVSLRFHRKMKPLIARLERRYTTQYLLSAVRLPVGNANRMYLLIREQISKGMKYFFEMEFSELKNKLMIESTETYESYMQFNNQFFKRSARQIINNTEFTHLEIEIVERVKRRAHKLRISYKYTPDKELGKKELKQTKAVNRKVQEEKIESELRLFGHRWHNQAEAKQQKLNWSDGLTSQQAMEKQKSK